jgi:radical SAM superfamily enzyme YgiQ (UPF0313 family)
MAPAIGPIGLDYIAASARREGIEVEVLDLGLVEEPDKTMKDYFDRNNPELVGLSFRNSDDCFWPSADWFVPGLKNTVEKIRRLTDAPIVVGGVGFSIFARSIFEYVNIDFGVCGDGEAAIVALTNQLRGKRNFDQVPGLIWRQDEKTIENPPIFLLCDKDSETDSISLGSARDFIDNRAYFQKGGQCGIETKRGCNRHCVYCADSLAKGARLRLRNPAEIADEVQSLLCQGIDVLHICDAEFNVSRSHAYAVCEEFIERSLGEKVRWYAYMSPTPFDADLAGAMARAGCIGIDFTGDSASESMLKIYRQQHNRRDLAEAVKLCRDNNIAVMVDLLLGGPGETPETVRETIEFIKKIDPDCAGATLGMRIYPRTEMAKMVAAELLPDNVTIRRKYDGPVDLLKPTFYISKALGENPSGLVKEMIAGDRRFFEPAEEIDMQTSSEDDASDYNYNDNEPLLQAIEKGARGAYWHILHQMRT